MGIAQNRHDKAKWKKKRHPKSKCGVARCPVCHPHKYIGGNHKGRVKAKYAQTKYYRLSRSLISAIERDRERVESILDTM